MTCLYIYMYRGRLWTIARIARKMSNFTRSCEWFILEKEGGDVFVGEEIF